VSDKVDRLVGVLSFVLQTPGQAATLSEIVNAVHQPLSSTHDLLRAMVAGGLLEVDAGKRYHPGPVLLRLALQALDQVDIVATSRPHLEELVRKVGHDAYLAIRSGDTVSYVARRPGTYRAALDIRLGEPVPLHSSAVGKLFCAFHTDLGQRMLAGPLPSLTPHTIVDAGQLGRELDEIRERGISISVEETITGIVGFGAPVHDTTGRMLAAVHISAFKDNLAADDTPRIDEAVRRCAAHIERALRSGSLTEALS
jgi:IclR family acetate operon transcriptional repressor